MLKLILFSVVTCWNSSFSRGNMLKLNVFSLGNHGQNTTFRSTQQKELLRDFAGDANILRHMHVNGKSMLSWSKPRSLRFGGSSLLVSPCFASISLRYNNFHFHHQAIWSKAVGEIPVIHSNYIVITWVPQMIPWLGKHFDKPSMAGEPLHLSVSMVYARQKLVGKLNIIMTGLGWLVGKPPRPQLFVDVLLFLGA